MPILNYKYMYICTGNSANITIKYFLMSNNKVLKKHRVCLDLSVIELALIKSSLELSYAQASRILWLPDSDCTVMRDRRTVKRISRLVRLVEAFDSHLRRIFNEVR